MDYQILKDIPAPKVKTYCQYPFDKLEVGQSFFIPDAQKRSVQQTCRNWSKRLQKTFIADDYTMSAGQIDKADVGVMVWRTK